MTEKHQKILNTVLRCTSAYILTDSEEFKEIKETLINLMEKDTPKAPISAPYYHIDGPSKSHFFPMCPNCHNNSGIQDYCKNCGQKLDWSNNKKEDL